MKLVEITNSNTLTKQLIISIINFGMIEGIVVFILDTFIDVFIRVPVHLIITLIQSIVFDRIALNNLESRVLEQKELYEIYQDNNDYIPDKRVTYHQHYLFLYRSSYVDYQHMKHKHERRVLFMIPFSGILVPIMSIRENDQEVIVYE